MHKEKIVDFLVGNVKRDDPFTLRRVILANVFVFLLVILLILFFLLNLLVFDKKIVAWIDFIGALLGFWALIELRIFNRLQRAILIADIAIVLFFTVFVYIDEGKDYGLIWLSFFPLFMIPLNGYRWGVVITVVFLIAIFLLAYANLGIWQDGAWNLNAFVRFAVAVTIITYATYINEVSIYKTNRALERMQKKQFRYNRMLKEVSRRDALTGVFNRRAIGALYREYFRAAEAGEEPLAVIMLDIDYFKRINDTYGHAVGDAVLIRIAKALENAIRETDALGRWGGEEFLILLPGCLLPVAMKRAEVLRQTVASISHPEVAWTVTASLGVAQYRFGDDIPTLLQRADEALYLAKKEGRNRVEVL